MSGAPWGFGVNRAEIQQLVRELVIIATKLPPEQVYLTDAAARGPQPPRPWASIELGAPIGTLRTGNDEQLWPTNEQWTITVNSVAGTPQRLTILGVNYDYTAATGDVTASRDGLLAAITAGAPSQFTWTGQGVDQIVLDSVVPGLRLLVAAGTGNDITAVKNLGNALNRNLRHYELQCVVRCNGLMDIEAPTTTESGQSLADLVDTVLASRDMTEKMRLCGHTPVDVSQIFAGGPRAKQQENEGVVRIVVATTGRFDIDASSVTAAPMVPIVTQ